MNKKLNIQKSNFYNEASLYALADLAADTDVEQIVATESMLRDLKTICITDVDGTYINTNGAVRGAQAKALAKIANTSFEEAYENLEKNGLKNAVEEYMSLDNFFTGPYKTFDPVEAASLGQMTVFEDALRFTQSGVPTVAISNSSEQATRNKLRALNLEKELVGIHAAFLKNEAKPNIYLAEKAIKDLDESGWYNSNQQIIHLGDQEYDVAFGNKIKEIHPNTVNILIDRGKKYRGEAKPDYVIKSFDDLDNL